MSTTCINPRCGKIVPAGHEGGWCIACNAAVVAAEDADRDSLQEQEAADRQADHDDSIGDVIDPHEAYGFDHSWEL